MLEINIIAVVHITLHNTANALFKRERMWYRIIFYLANLITIFWLEVCILNKIYSLKCWVEYYLIVLDLL